MSDKILNLKLPLSEREALSLELATIVTVSGLLFTGRNRFHIRAIEENLIPPIDFNKINCFFHVGPVMKQTSKGWKIVSIEPTSSIRFERYSGSVIRKLKLRTLIGKTTMGPATSVALSEVHGIHLTKIGICGNLLAHQVKKVHDVFFLDELGKTEATWIFEVEHFGPFFVDIDAYGNNYFRKLHDKIRSRFSVVNKFLDIPEEFSFTDVD